MLTSTTPEVLAESFSASESTASESVEDIAAWNTASTGEPDTSDDGTGLVDGESTGTEEEESPVRQTEEAIPEESTGTEAVDSFSDGDSILSEEGTMETVSPDDAGSEEFIPEDITEMLTQDLFGEESEIELCLNLLTGGETSSTSLSFSLSLQEALDIAGTGSGAVLSRSGDGLTVIGSAGLVLLSNVKTQEYMDKNIQLTNTESVFNLRAPQEFTDITSTEGETGSKITLNYLRLGDQVNPYVGSLLFAEQSNVPILTSRALFNAISADAELDTISFQFTNEVSIVDTLLLAERVEKGNNNGILTCNVTLTVPTSGEEDAISATIGGIIGTLGTQDAGASASVTLTLEN